MQVVVRGIPVHYEAAGEGRPVVFLHGSWTDHRLMSVGFEPIFDTHPGWQRFYPDLPGMGRTPGPDWITDEAGMLDVVEGFVDAIAPGGGAAIVGVSYGGYLALGLVHRRGSDLAGLAAIAPAVRLDDQAPLPRHEVFARDDAVVADVTEAERPWLAVSVVQSAENLAFFRTAAMPGRALADTAFLERLEGRNLPFDVRHPPEPFTRPSLIVAGRQDTVVGWAGTPSILDSYPRATLAVLDRAGHALLTEQRSLLGSLFSEWLHRMEQERLVSS